MNIKTHGYKMSKDTKLWLAIVYKIYYKLMKTTLEPQALIEKPKVHTLLLYLIIGVIRKYCRASTTRKQSK